jgi:transposase
MDFDVDGISQQSVALEPVRQVDINAARYGRGSFNTNGGRYESGQSFSDEKWLELIGTYEHLLKAHGSCGIRELARCCHISRGSAKKAIQFFDTGLIERKRRGHGRKGVGAILRFGHEHHEFLYNLYLSRPSLPSEAYIYEFERKFGMVLSRTFVSSWFNKVGPYKGTLRMTSKVPHAKNSRRVLDMMTDYLSFIVKIRDQTRIVFVDEKPLKEKDLFFKVRRDPFTGNIPHHTRSCNANSKNIYNIFAAVTAKRNVRRNVEYVILEETGDAYLFREFVLHLIREGTLVEGDIFVVDNCSIHTKGENAELEDLLWREHEILMIPLPPYHPELNPTEFVFHHLVETLRAEYARYGCNSELEFRSVLELTIDQLGFGIVWKMFLKCGYLKN